MIRLVRKYLLCKYIVGEGWIISGPNKGKSCFFPFEYKGKIFDRCTTEDAIGSPWCATTPKYSNKDFGYCNCPIGNIDLRVYPKNRYSN